MKEFDLIVIGGGPGGYVGAIRGAQMGASVALIEKDNLGGTCLNRGCIPTKALYYSAKALKAAHKAADFGVTVGDVSFDLSKAVSRKDDVVEKLVGGVGQLLKANGVQVIKGTGALEGNGKVKVDSTSDAGNATEVIAGKGIVIATGSEPALIPAFAIDHKNVITSTEALNLKTLPKSMLVIGAGVMGCEFATIFARFGTSVTVVELLPAILSTEDKSIVRVVEKSMKAMGVEIHKEVMVDSVEVVEDGVVKTTLKDGTVFTTEKVLVSIGRSFNSEGIGLDNAGVDVDRGCISVNDKMETNAKGVYAIGDVTGGMLLAHVASTEAEVAVKNALGKCETMDYSVIPAGIFTDPEIASVGIKEKDAKAEGIDINVGRFPYLACGKALTMGETDGFVQIITEAGDKGRVLGASIVGAHATDLIGEVAVVMRAGLFARDIMETVHAHPTLPEMVLEAAEDTAGVAVHKVGRRRK